MLVLPALHLLPQGGGALHCSLHTAPQCSGAAPSPLRKHGRSLRPAGRAAVRTSSPGCQKDHCTVPLPGVRAMAQSHLSPLGSEAQMSPTCSACLHSSPAGCARSLSRLGGVTGHPQAPRKPKEGVARAFEDPRPPIPPSASFSPSSRTRSKAIPWSCWPYTLPSFGGSGPRTAHVALG